MMIVVRFKPHSAKTLKLGAKPIPTLVHKISQAPEKLKTQHNIFGLA